MKHFTKHLLSITLLLMASVLSFAQSKQIAFPGAEGFGRYATGGRGGEVRHVTNLNDSGTGSLRAALSGSAKKIVVFDVSGTIHLKSQLNIPANTTIAGQTAPGDGICVADCPCNINGDNIVVRYMRFRLGNKNVDLDLAGDGRYDGWDGFGALDRKNIIVDHCSVSWSIDECLSMSGCSDITVQWCLVSQSMVKGHSKLSHGYGGNWGGAGSSYHHNMMIHHNSRVPRLGPRPTTQLDERMDMRNNVFYNWGGNGCYGGEAMKVNIVNNYYKPGPATDARKEVYRYRIAAPGIRTTEYITNYPDYKDAWHIWGKFYVTGNVNPDYPALSASDDNQWKMGIHEQIDASGNDGTYTSVTQDTIRIKEPIPYVAVTTHSAEMAYEKVLQYVGASLHRDSHDELMVSDARNRKATYTGTGNPSGMINNQDDNKPSGAGSDWSAWPTLNSSDAPVDTDGDGMPDAWEDAHGLDKNDKTDGAKTVAGSWYTNVEVYLNSIVEDITNGQNAGGIMMGETLPGEATTVQYTLSQGTYTGTTDNTWNFKDGLTITGGSAYTAVNTDGKTADTYFQAEANKQYTITLPDSISITSVTFSGYCNMSGTKTARLSELNGTTYTTSYIFASRNATTVNSHTINLDTPATGSLTFTIGNNPAAIVISLSGVKEGSGITYEPGEEPTPEPSDETTFDISPETHQDAWDFGDISITISGKDYLEGHVASDFTGIKFSRNTNYTVNIPEGKVINSVEVKGYSNGDGTTYVATLGDNTFTADEHIYASKETSSHTFQLATPATGTMIFRPSGDNQMVATLKLFATTTGISTVYNNVVPADGAIYNLQGVRVANPQRGIYIRNGKKIVIK